MGDVDVDKLARRSKVLYKNNVQVCKSQLKKETEFLEKWHGVSERDIGRQESQVRKKLEQFQKEKEKYKTGTEEILCSEILDRSSSHKKTPRNQSYHSPLPTRPNRRAPANVSPRSIAQLKRDAPTNLVQRSESPTKLMVKSKKESAQAQENTAAFLKGERCHRRASLPAGVFSTLKSDIPMVIVTDVEGACSVAVCETIRENREENAHHPEKPDHDRKKSPGHPHPTQSDIDNLYATAMAAATNKDEIFHSNSRCSVRSSRSVRRRESQVSHTGHSVIDLAKLKEIEDLLKETSNYRKKHKSTPINTHASRQQQRRLEKLKDVLDTLKRSPKEAEFRPMEMLNCSYLRLSQANVEELEEMVRAEGQDPGLHYHSDLTGYDLFAELKKEAEELLRKEEEEDTLVSVSQFSTKVHTPRQKASVR